MSNIQTYYGIQHIYEQKKPKEEVIALINTVEDKNDTFETDGHATLLHLVSHFADADAVKYLLENGAKGTVVNDYGYTPLHSLCKLGRGNWRKRASYEAFYNTADVLLKAKVSTMRKDESGKTSYHWAAEDGIYPIIQAMIDNGAKIGMTDNYGNTVLHLACEGVRHVIESIPYAEAHLKQSLEHAEKPSGSANLDRIHREHVEYNQRELDNDNALLEDYFQVVKALVAYGLDPDEKNNCGDAALDYAVKHNAKKIAAFLKGEYDENDPDSAVTGGMTLHQAAHKGDIDALKAIIAKGADVNEVSDSEEREIQGKTPLTVACVKVNPEAVQVLLDAGADPNFKSGEHGRSVLYYFIHEAQSNVRDHTYKNKNIQKILKSLKDVGLNINDYVDDESNTAFIEACRISSSARINNNSFDSLLIDAILGMGCDVNLSNKHGETALMLMAKKNLETENLFITLLENGANVDVADKNGNTPLMYAANNRDQSAAKTYIEIMSEFGNLKVDAVNNDGKTALELATEHGHEAVVKVLLTM